MSKFLSFGSLTQLIRLFLTLLTTMIPCISKSFKGSLQNPYLLLGRCMALIVKRSWLELVHRETKQASKFIFNDVSTPSSQNPKLFNSGPDNELKSTLDISPNPEDLWEQHPVWASAKLGGEDAAAQGFRFGAQDESTPDLNSSQNRSGTGSSLLNSPFSSSLDFCSVPNISAANLFSPPRPHKK